MAINLLLDEVERLHGISARLSELANQHEQITTELLTIAGNVHSAATLLAVVLATKFNRPPG